MKKAIIFDLDGTLWDASEPIAESWNVYIRMKAPDVDKVITKDDIRGVCGKTMDEFADILIGDLEAPLRYELMEGCCAYEVEYLKGNGGMLYPELIETLKKLSKKYHLYIVSNCQVGYIQDFIDWSETADLFEDTEDFGTTGKGKAENIRLLCERNQIDRAVYVGDTIMDYRSTVEAGMPFIFASYGYGKVEEDVPVIDCFAQLPEVVSGILDVD